MTKNEVIDRLVEKGKELFTKDFNQADAKRLYNVLFGIEGLFTRTLVNGEKIQLTGFGTFHPKQRKARSVFIPVSGETKTVPAKIAVTFSIGSMLAKEVNK